MSGACRYEAEPVTTSTAGAGAGAECEEALGSVSPVSSSGQPAVSPGGQAPTHDPGPGPVLGPGKGRRGRPRKHAPKLPLPPLYVFIRNLLHSPGYNPSVVSWVDEDTGCFKVKQYHKSSFNVLFFATIKKIV